MPKINAVVVLLSVLDVTPYEGNPRVNDETVEALKRSIRKYGFNQPIVVDRKHVVIKGHARLKAAQELGMPEIPCIVSTRTSKANQADRILDNQIHDLTRWDREALDVEMRDVEDAVSAVLGRSERGYAGVGEGSVSQQRVEDAIDNLTEVAERTQDMIRVVCEDCGEEMLIARKAVESL